MTKNPLLQKKFAEGFEQGKEQGVKEGIARSIAFFKQKFEGLENVEGIGPKTFEKIKDQLGEQYFNK